jgi:DNA-binding winged helix-turn-helix (wHTH) protein
MLAGSKTVFRFAAYEADTDSAELRKSGVRIRVPEQAFRVLTALLERPGQMVSREEMKQRLWPQDTFVDFDHGLNTVINKLREALGDSATNPRFIETLARRGYRFLASVEVHDRLSGTSPTPSKDSTAGTADGRTVTPVESANASLSILTRSEELPRVGHQYARILFVLIQVMYLVFYSVALARLPQLDATVERVFSHSSWIVALTLLSALAGVPVRLYLISGTVFRVPSFSRNFRRIFIAVILIDELWALSPLLLTPQIGIGLALAATAALIYVPFSERTLVLMADRGKEA